MTLNETRHIVQIPVFSATELLRRHRLDLSAQKLRNALLANGYLLELYRPSLSKRNARKKCYLLTSKGQLFGRNCASLAHPIHTVPKYYGEFFLLLVHLCGLLPSEQQQTFELKVANRGG